ncbi:multidrug effflux MFS transporter [Marinomonas sp. C1424]|uniref:Bcr/CflA family efflux transporter n=2 Tax=Marinomonas transparens TaxID=2795388 RepID=A0A934JW19_9GAMM|nr:multidrug effflux MFS transporter [Marinomonas transparens]
MMSLTALSMDAILPAFSHIAADLNIQDYQQTQWIISAMVFGMVFGEIVFGPLSDTLGRKKSIFLGVGIFIIGSFIALLASSLTMLLVGRMIQGLGVSGPKIVSRAMIRDMYKGAAMARIMSYVMMIFILVPLLAPFLGQLVMLLGSWRWVFAVLIAQALIASIWMWLRQPETLPKEKRVPFVFSQIAQNTYLIVSRRDVMAFTLLLGCVFACVMFYISIAQSIFQDIYQVGERFPLYFALLAIGSSLVNFFNAKIVMRIGMKRCVYGALMIMISLSFLLLVVVWSFDGVPPFHLFMGICMVLFSCLSMVFGNVNAMAMEPLGQTAGLGASIISSLSSFIAIILSVTVGLFYHFTLTPLAAGFLVFSCIAIACLVFATRSSSGNLDR